MKYRLFFLALVASLGTSVLAQHAGHGPRDAVPRKPDAAPDKSPRAPPAVKQETSTSLTPAFLGYRPFNPQEPAKGWRAANEEVREAGGHVGIAKGSHGAGHREDGKK